MRVERVKRAALVTGALASGAGIVWSVAGAWLEQNVSWSRLAGEGIFLWGVGILVLSYAGALAWERRVRWGTSAVAGVVSMVMIALCLSLDADKYSPMRTDVTFAKVNRLSDQTLRVIGEMGAQSAVEQVEVTTFLSPETEEDWRLERKVRELLEEYERAGHGRIVVRHLDIRGSPEKVQTVLQQLGLALVEEDSAVFSTGTGQGRRSKEVLRGEMEMEDPSQRGFGGERRKLFRGEEAFTGALLGLLQAQPTRVYFLTGHGEADPGSFEDAGCGLWAEQLQRKGFEMAGTLALADGQGIPDDCGVLVVAGPREEVAPWELDLMATYIEEGGPALFMLDALTEETGLEKFLMRYGVKVGDDLVIDKEKSMRSELNPAMKDYPPHAITAPLSGTRTALFGARSVEGLPVDGDARKAFGIRILQSSPRSWAETDTRGFLDGESPRLDREDRLGPVGLAVAASPQGLRERVEVGERLEVRLVVIGDVDVASGLGMKLNPPNKGFLLNVMNWLRREEKLVSIPSRDVEERQLRLASAERRKVGLIVLVGLPFGALACGVLVWVIRGSRAGGKAAADRRSR